MQQHEEGAVMRSVSRIIREVVTVPPGRYFLGDPRYAMGDDGFTQVLVSSDHFTRPVGIAADPDIWVVAFETAFGDGIYRDQFGASYPVASGLIGLVSTQMQWPCAELDRLGRVVTFDEEAEASTDDCGRMQFGPYKINTREGS